MGHDKQAIGICSGLEPSQPYVCLNPDSIIVVHSLPINLITNDPTYLLIIVSFDKEQNYFQRLLN